MSGSAYEGGAVFIAFLYGRRETIEWTFVRQRVIIKAVWNENIKMQLPETLRILKSDRKVIIKYSMEADLAVARFSGTKGHKTG